MSAEPATDYEKESERAIRRLDGEHEMFTLIKGSIGGDENLDTSVLSTIDEAAAQSPEQVGLYRFSMLHTMFEMVLEQTEISRTDLAALLLNGPVDREVTDERTE